MTQEEKELLLKDLCARLPYKPKVHIEHYVFYDEHEPCEPYDTELDPSVLELSLSVLYNRYAGAEIKPYLRPMSSMTEEEEKELSRKYNWDIRGNQISIRYHSEGYWDNETECPTEEYLNLFDWLNSHYFDYRGLNKKGLALEAPEGMYKF